MIAFKMHLACWPPSTPLGPQVRDSVVTYLRGSGASERELEVRSWPWLAGPAVELVVTPCTQECLPSPCPFQPHD